MVRKGYTPEQIINKLSESERISFDYLKFL